MLAEYGAFCDWSEDLLTQLEENRKSNSSVVQGSLVSQTTYPINRVFDDDYDYIIIAERLEDNDINDYYENNKGFSGRKYRSYS